MKNYKNYDCIGGLGSAYFKDKRGDVYFKRWKAITPWDRILKFFDRKKYYLDGRVK